MFLRWTHCLLVPRHMSWFCLHFKVISSSVRKETGSVPAQLRNHSPLHGVTPFHHDEQPPDNDAPPYPITLRAAMPQRWLLTSPMWSPLLPCSKSLGHLQLHLQNMTLDSFLPLDPPPTVAPVRVTLTPPDDRRRVPFSRYNTTERPVDAQLEQEVVELLVEMRNERQINRLFLEPSSQLQRILTKEDCLTLFRATCVPPPGALWDVYRWAANLGKVCFNFELEDPKDFSCLDAYDWCDWRWMRSVLFDVDDPHALDWSASEVDPRRSHLSSFSRSPSRPEVGTVYGFTPAAPWRLAFRLGGRFCLVC